MYIVHYSISTVHVNGRTVFLFSVGYDVVAVDHHPPVIDKTVRAELLLFILKNDSIKKKTLLLRSPSL